jgi:anti-sigma factor RsiW
MRGDDTRRMPPDGLSDEGLWQRSRVTDIVETEAERYLDLAGYADGRLDPDDRERVAEWLASDPVAAGDVAAARVSPLPAALPETAIARACALVDGDQPQRATVIPFRSRQRFGSRLHGMVRWGSLVAAMAVASWVGFTLGMDTSLSVAQVRQTGEDSFFGELLDPSADLTRDLTEGTQT